MVRAPDALAAVEILDAEHDAQRRVFLVELGTVLEPFVDVAVRVPHEDAEACVETAGVVEADFKRYAFLVHVGLDMEVGNESGVSEDEVHVSEDTAEGVLVPGEADGHFAGVGKAVVRTFVGFAAEVNTAVGCTHVRDADAEDVFFAELDGLLRFEDKGGVGAEVVAEELAVEPYGRVSRDAFESKEYALGDLFFVVDSESLEIESAVLRHQKLFE